MKINPKNKMYSIKKIKNHYYVYSWRYIPKTSRDNEEKRFNWIYEGPLHKRGGEFIKQLKEEEQKDFWLEIEFLELKEQETQRIKVLLCADSNYLIKRQAINSLTADKQAQPLKELQASIRNRVRKLTKEMFQDLDTERYIKFINNGGTIDDLRRKIRM